MRDYTVHRTVIRQTRIGRNRAKVYALIIISLMTIGLVLGRKLPVTQNRQEGSSEKTQSASSGISPSAPPKKLKTEVEKIIENATGTYSIYGVDLTTGEEWGINESTVLTAASINKVPILATVYHLAGSGEIDLERIIVPQPHDIQDWGTGSIRYDKPGTPYSIKTLARVMMEKSDNTAAYILGTQVIGLEKIQELIESWEMTQTEMKENKTSAKDMAKLFLKMYRGEITTPALTQEMMGFMDESDTEDRIPAGVPQSIRVYHKIGDEVNKIHDAGIIDLPNRPYYLGILTTDQTDEEKTKETMRKISETVFRLMNQS